MRFIPGRIYKRIEWGNAEFTIGKTYEAVGYASLINKGLKSYGCYEYFKLIEGNRLSLETTKGRRRITCIRSK